MNVILLTAIILTVVPGLLCLERPCTRRSTTQVYNNFVHRHVLQTSFNKMSRAGWATYLQAQGLCGRALVQSFIDAPLWEVEQICSPNGRRLKRNLCKSSSHLTVYDVRSIVTWFCNVPMVTRTRQYVTVACDNVRNLCRPVHYQKDNGHIPGNLPCVR